MKPLILLLISICLASTGSLAQHPLVGTWEMISVKGIDAEGEPFFLDTTAVRETKIITPTHYMLIAWDVDGDSLLFNRTMGGEVRLEGEKYIEIPMQASVQIFENIKVDFTWKLDGDIFTQSGTIVRPDGKLIVLEALKFRRVGDTKPNTKNPGIGTWKQVSGHYTNAGGQQTSAFNEAQKRFLVVTPTHFMRMDHNDKEFNGVTFGTYDMKGDSIITVPYFSTYTSDTAGSKYMQKVEGNTIHFTAKGKTPDGQTASHYYVFEKY